MRSAVYAVDAYRCSDVATTDRAEWWSELVSSIHSRMEFRVRDDYRGRIEHQHTEAYQLVRWWGDEEFIKRSGSDVRRHPHGAYELLVPVTGAMMIRQADTALKLEPGGLALATLDAPMDMWHSDNFSCLALVIPRTRVDARIGGPLTRTVGLNAEHGMGRIVVDLLGSLRSQAHMIDGLDFDAAADRAVDLLCLAYGGALLPPVYETQDNLAATIRRYVRANAHDLSLTGAAVAAELGWSLRQIQARLQRTGTTPSMLIREERLELARLRLQHPGWDHRTVASVARSSGFSNPSTFSNAYRERFGERPTDTRERCRAHRASESPQSR
ncbi:MAG TPA: helix-turn-helix transcriptional regulator [Streptosporangiaceae bacterium]|nr:helix-turn-helix transcriptional regulator [Streptosporangiaceae bacterium]